MIHKALKDAAEDGLISANPAQGLKLPQRHAEETKALSSEQVGALLEAACENRLEAHYVVALHTGLRRGELLALRWNDIDFEKGTLRVDESLDQHGSVHTPKTEESRRTLRLTPVSLAALRAHRARQNEVRLGVGERGEDNDLVFPNTVGKPMNPSNLYRREFPPLLSKASLEDEGFTFHSLRHTFANTLAEKGVHPATAQKLLGHKDIRMTLAIYTHATDDVHDVAVDAIAEAFP
jgi:integrase